MHPLLLPVSFLAAVEVYIATSLDLSALRRRCPQCHGSRLRRINYTSSGQE